jgi:aspartate aminotransferase
MFEAGEELKARLGPENVFDLSLGNPIDEPPVEFLRELMRQTHNPRPGMHRYMANAGYPATRAAVATAISKELGLSFKGSDIVMTCGAAAGLNVVLKTMLNAGDEVIVVSPYFPEYLSYIDNHGGIVRIVEAGDDFLPIPEKIEQAISGKTRAIILNTPNNPTGVVYNEELLGGLASVLERQSHRLGHSIYLISDEPYRRLIYDGIQFSSPLNHYRQAIIATSFSKDLSLPGERIGYIAVNPEIDDKDELVAGFIYANRVLGFVNAPALMQNVVTNLMNATVSVAEYQHRRDYLYKGLIKAGYNVIKPQGAFYLFPGVPGGEDINFVQRLMEYGVLAVPGSGFGREGYMRLSFCVNQVTLEGAVKGLTKAIQEG